MRMRRLPWANEYLASSKSRIQEPQKLKGIWRQTFPGRLHLEIGCGKGGYACEMAALYPKESFIALEKNESAAAMAARKMDEQEKNAPRLIWADASDLCEWFEDGELDVIHLNFSDPWPKKRNAKRRLSAPSFLKQYQRVLSEDGCIQMKTDNQDLFEYSLVQMAQNGFLLEDVSVDFRRNEHPEDAYTEYERKFAAQGQPVYRAQWRKA